MRHRVHRRRWFSAAATTSLILASGVIAVAGTAGPSSAATIDGADTVGATPIVPKPVSPGVPVADGQTLGAVTDATAGGASLELTTERGAMRVTFLDDETFRIEADPDGEFTDPANSPSNDPQRTANIVVGTDDFAGASPTLTDGDVVTFATDAVRVEIDSDTGLLSAERTDGTRIFAESSPLTFTQNAATQHLDVADGEQFLGGGMQNGRSIHTGATINISNNFDWDDDGYPNAVPYYMSSSGYGVLRNTFAPGTYDFADGTTTHAEDRFDAYYFAGDYKGALDSYTKLTGRPLMPPVYALEYGDADCYNRGNDAYTGEKTPGKLETLDAVAIAEGFVEHDMPGGWLLVNDGYNCEYQDLPEAVTQIKEKTGLETGLWTQRSLTEQEYEVGEAGIRMRKLDVAWVGSGYRLALTGCEAAHDGIEEYSDARGTSLMVEGWAGSQRCGMQWTGDHSGNLDAVRWQVSALTGAGNSGLAFSTGDVDGIFGGSTTSYVRDLQWKAFAPALYSMSGWSSVDKRPWLYGEEATEINRFYLQLRQQLMPFIYTLAENSHASGTPMMRSLALEYPQDPGSYSVEANNEFLLGTDYLVAPVFTDSDVRNGIYLPEGETWVDFWSGQRYEGGQVLDGHPAPLDELPIFVRAGALVPMGPIARNASLVPEDAPLTLSVYPSGESSFSLYEDDKVTRAYKTGESATQDFTVSAPTAGPGDVTVTIGERVGSYDGMAASRPYVIEAHTGSEPAGVAVDGTSLDQVADATAEVGWSFADGVVTVNVGDIASGDGATVVLSDTSAVGGVDGDAEAAQVRVTVADEVFQGEETTVTASFSNFGVDDKTDVTLSAVLPDGWTLVSSEGAELGTVAAGERPEATFVVRPETGSAGGLQTVRVEAAYTSASGKAMETSGANQISVAYGSLQSAYNRISITDLEHAALGDFDGGGATFSAAALAEAGAEPGGTVVFDGNEYAWPESVSSPNSVEPAGQTIALSGQGTHLSVLASAAAGSGVSAPLTVVYEDGSTSREEIFFPNWLPQASGLGDAQVAIPSLGRNNSQGEYEYADYTYQVYENSIYLNPNKEVRAIKLGTTPAVKFFSWAIVDEELPPGPTGEHWISDLEWESATNGWGVIGKDVANKDSASSPDAPLTSLWVDPETGEARTYEKGLGVHAEGRIRYYLGGQCLSFTAEATQEKGFSGNVVFRVESGDDVLYSSKTLTGAMAPEAVDVDLTGRMFLDLVITAPNGISGAHGIWGDAKLVCQDESGGGDPDAGSDGTSDSGSDGSSDDGANGASDDGANGANGASDDGANGSSDDGANGASDDGANGASDDGANGASDDGANGSSDDGANGASDDGADGTSDDGSDGSTGDDQAGGTADSVGAADAAGTADSGGDDTGAAAGAAGASDGASDAGAGSGATGGTTGADASGGSDGGDATGGSGVTDPGAGADVDADLQPLPDTGSALSPAMIGLTALLLAVGAGAVLTARHRTRRES